MTTPRLISTLCRCGSQDYAHSPCPLGATCPVAVEAQGDIDDEHEHCTGEDWFGILHLCRCTKFQSRSDFE